MDSCLEVRAYYPFEQYCADRESHIREVAGRPPDFSGASQETRDMCWLVKSFGVANELRHRLITMANCHVNIKEV